MARSTLRWLAFFGLGAPAVYAAATAAGSILDPRYSQIRHHVSELTATGAPTWAALAPAYIAYNVLVAGLGVTLYLIWRNRLFGIGAGLLGINAVAGVLSVTWLRQDPGGIPTTPAGVGHVVAAGVMVLMVVIATFLYGVAFRRTAAWPPLSRLSFAIGVGLLIVGPIGVIAADSDVAGLAERGPIGLFLVWLGATGGHALVRSRRAARAAMEPAA
jgi:hypothetical protein